MVLRLSNGTLLTLSRARAHGGVTANIYIDAAKSVVLKQATERLQAQSLMHEDCVLRRLARMPWCPERLCFDAQSMTLVTSHVGRPLGPADLLYMPDLLHRMQAILADLGRLQVEHADIVKPHWRKTELQRLFALQAHEKPGEIRAVLAKNAPLGVEFHVTGDGGLALLDFGIATVEGSRKCENVTTDIPPLRKGLARISDDDAVQMLVALRAHLQNARSPPPWTAPAEE